MSKLKSQEEMFAYSKTLSVIPAEDLANLLVASKIKVPSYIHRFVLRETIYPKVFANALYQTYTDELKYRLRGYHDYSIYLLDKLISDYNLDFDAAKYKEIFFDILFLNADQYGIKEHFISELDKLKYKYAVDFETITYGNFMNSFGKLFYEPSGYLDGVKLQILKDIMIHSSTLGDLRGLGEKYGVKVPRRINKTQLIQILAKRFRLSDQEIVLLDDKSVLELEIYAKEKGFSISIDLKKSDMVEFIVYSLGLYHQEVVKDAHDYNVPLAVDLDSVKIEEITFAANDQDIPVVPLEEAVVPPQKEPETPKVEEPQPLLPTPVVVEPQPAILEEEVATPTAPEPQKPPLKESRKESRKEPVLEKQPDIVPAEPAVAKPQPTPEPELALRPLFTEGSKNYSEEERALLDEKINLIIKKYQRKRRQKAFWTVFWIVIGVAILGFVAFAYVTYATTGSLPWGIPVFWE